MKRLITVVLFILSIPIFSQHLLVVPEEFMALSLDSGIQKLDVRTGIEFETIGHIPGFIHVNIGATHFKDSVLNYFDRDRPIMVTCFSGHRSSDAVVKLKEMGFRNIYELKGGIIAWLGAGYKIE